MQSREKRKEKNVQCLKQSLRIQNSKECLIKKKSQAQREIMWYSKPYLWNRIKQFTGKDTKQLEMMCNFISNPEMQVIQSTFTKLIKKKMNLAELLLMIYRKKFLSI